MTMPFPRFNKAGAIGIYGTLLLHAAALFFALYFQSPGSRYSRQGESLQTTFYVGLGQAAAEHKPVESNAPPNNPPSGDSKPLNGSGVLGTPAPDALAKHRKDQTRDEDVSRFYAPNMLESQPRYASDPEYFLLDGLPPSHEPIRLRLYIDETGKLADIAVLHEDERDREVGLRVRAMFSMSRFLPGSIKMHYVPSFMDIEVNVNDADAPKPARPH